jgi:cytochrome c oxidase subunit II
MSDLFRRLLFLPEPGTDLAASIDHLHFLVISVTLIGAAGVGAAVIFLLIRYRRRPGGPASVEVKPRAIHEALFVGVPLVLFLAFFFIGFPLYVNLQTPPKDAMDVYVEAKQWMWKFAYPGGPNSLNVLRVPVGRPVRLLLTSRDVIHSFFVPDFRLKQDVLPGRYTQTWFQVREPGRHQIFCAEFCGVGHSTMLGEIWAMAPAEFDTWRVEQRQGDLALAQDSPPAAPDSAPNRSVLVQEGERLAGTYGCLKCHTIDGEPHIGPTWSGLYLKREKLADGTSVVADEGYLTRSMMDPGAQIAAGYQNLMPTYQGRIPPPDTAAIIEYIKSLRGETVNRPPSEGPIYVPVRK